LDWQQKVKWLRALKFENQAMGTRVTDILNFFKKNFKIKSTNFDVNDANDENDENLIRQGWVTFRTIVPGNLITEFNKILSVSKQNKKNYFEQNFFHDFC
jgi:hypothetical protein